MLLHARFQNFMWIDNAHRRKQKYKPLDNKIDKINKATSEVEVGSWANQTQIMMKWWHCINKDHVGIVYGYLVTSAYWNYSFLSYRDNLRSIFFFFFFLCSFFDIVSCSDVNSFYSIIFCYFLSSFDNFLCLSFENPSLNSLKLNFSLLTWFISFFSISKCC